MTPREVHRVEVVTAPGRPRPSMTRGTWNLSISSSLGQSPFHQCTPQLGQSPFHHACNL